jgi:hypothetical protein
MAGGSYRYYCLDGAGKLHSAVGFEAESDEAAIALIEAKHSDARCEVWQGNRLVGKVPAKRPHA